MTLHIGQAHEAASLSSPKRHSETGVGKRRSNAFAVIPCPMLRAAAERVATGLRNDLGDATSQAEAHAVLLALAQAVHDHRNQRGPISLPGAATSLGRHVLELLRATILDEATETETGATSETVLPALRAIERIRAAISPHGVRDFASRLLTPDALEVLVEVAHDLRSPLTSILFLAETLQRGQSGDLNELQRRQLGLIYSAALGLSSLASDVIELARGGDSLVEPEPSPLSLNDIFESVRDIVRSLAEEKHLAVRLSPPSTDHRIGHALALGRVLLNLTTNALKFTETGFVELVAREKDGWCVEFSVRDTGPGINPAVLDRLYSAFRRLPGRGGFAFSSTGLGVTICRRLVEAMGSKLQVETRPGWGTRFFFELPLPPVPRS